MQLKKPATFEEQIEILRQKGIEIDDEDGAKNALITTNYYLLKGYLLKYKDKTSGKYVNPPTFSHICDLYHFDCELKNHYLYATVPVEQGIKNVIAYVIAMANVDNPAIYKEESFFSDKTDHERFLGEFNRIVGSRRKTPFVTHHMEKYDGEFPIWVAMELFTLGNTQSLYKNMPRSLRKEVARVFGTSPDVFYNWIDNIRKTRNIAAHNSRLYDVSLPYSPKHSKEFDKSLPLTKKVFDQFYLLQIIHPHTKTWNSIMTSLNTLFNAYDEIIELDSIGFPKNWKDFLVRK